MVVKAMVVSKDELKVAFKQLTKKENALVVLTVNEESEKDVAVIEEQGETIELEVESVLLELNQIFEVQIQSFEGYDYPEFADPEGGYVFLIN